MPAGPDPAAPRPLGGFLELELPGRRESYLSLWGASDSGLAFRNARSAFHALVHALEPTNVWLPAFVCPELAAVVPSSRLRFYPVGATLSPDPACLTDVRPGDVVLAIDYFGRAPNADFLQSLLALDGVTTVEDCAQALDTGRPAWGDWRLFSPRKLVGVPEGGLLAPRPGAPGEGLVARSRPERPPDHELSPAQLRFEDESGAHNEAWWAANQRREGAERVSSHRINQLAWRLLGLLDPGEHGLKRVRNFAHLSSRLSDWALLPERVPPYVPFGFPVVLPAARRASVRDALHRQRIFPAVHWPALPSPPERFPAEHELASRILTLPCDQRYNHADMERLADALLSALA